MLRKSEKNKRKSPHAYLLLFLIGILAFIFIAGTVLIGRGEKVKKSSNLWIVHPFIGIGYIFFNRFGRKNRENEDSKERLEKTEKKRTSPSSKKSKLTYRSRISIGKEEKKEAPSKRTVPLSRPINI